MKSYRVLNSVASAVAVLMIGIAPIGMHAQSAKAPAATVADKNLADELRQLREQVAKLQGAVGQKGMAQKSAAGMPGMQSQGAQSGMQPQSPMGMMSMMENERSSSMSSPSGNSMPMQGMSGMDMMGRMTGSSQMATQTALPGFPGLSHLYHVGATDFFLDHPEHITLSVDQQTKLGQIKEKALLDKASAQRKIDEAEQQLFTLTGADQPKLQEIQAQVKAIGELQGQQRVAYIQAVGQAAQVLTDEQRKSVVGSADSGAAQSHDHH